MPVSEREYMRTPRKKPSGSEVSHVDMSNFRAGVIGLVCIAAVLGFLFLAKQFSPNKKFSTKREQKTEHRLTLRDVAPVDINNASHLELTLLPRISSTKADAIIAERPFKTIDQLDDVYGIGPKTVANLRPYVTISNDSAASDEQLLSQQ